jgi:hypothetical protein
MNVVRRYKVLLDNILTRAQKRAGLAVSEDNNVRDIVCLEYKGRILATWFGPSIKPSDIQEKAQVYLSNIRRISQEITESHNITD